MKQTLCFIFAFQAVFGLENNYRCPACLPCDSNLERRNDAFQWTPIPNMALCMYGYDPFDMDTLMANDPDPGIKSQIFEPTFWSEELHSMQLREAFKNPNKINYISLV